MQKGARVRKLYWAKKQIGYCMVLSFREWQGSAGRLPNSTDQETPDGLVLDFTSGKAKTVIT